MEQKHKKKKHNWDRTAFILFCVVVPVLQFLIFYVYTNFSSILMAFTNIQGEISFDNFARFGREMSQKDSDLPIAFKNTMITFAINVIRYPFQVLVSYFIYKKVPGYNFYRIMFFIPTIVFGVAIAMVFTRMVGPNGAIAQWIGDVLNLDYVPELLADSRFAKYVIWGELLWLGFPGSLIIWGGTFARIPDDVLESGKIDGTTWWTEFTRIIVPMVWPTVSLQMVLLVCGIFGSTGSVWLLTKGDYGTHTISSWMYEFLLTYSGGAYNSNVFNYMSAVGLMITIVAITLSIGVRKWTDKAFSEVEF